MILYFIVGWIAGAVGMLMILNWWFHKHVEIHKIDQDGLETIEGLIHDEERRASESDMRCDCEGRGISQQDREDNGAYDMGRSSEQCVDNAESGKGNAEGRRNRRDADAV